MTLAERDALVLAHMPIAKKAARNLGARPHLGLDLCDIENEALIVLVACANRFDPDQGVPFAAYAGVSIKFGLRRLLRDRDTVGRNIRIDIFAYLGMFDELHVTLQRCPTESEIATALDWTIERVRATRVNAHRHRPVSLDVPIAEDGPTHAEMLADREELDNLISTADVAFILDSLQERERDIFTRLIAGQAHRRIAEDLGISAVRVSQIISRARARLHHLRPVAV